MRLGFRVGSVLFPQMAERRAAALMLTPRRRSASAVRAVPAGARSVVIPADGLILRGWEWGIGAKPTVVLVHGWSGIAADMAPLAMPLVDAGYRVLAPDMPAHGRSGGRRTSLVEWLRALDAIERSVGRIAALVGHSFGATAVTLRLAEGSRAGRAVLIAPAPGPAYFMDRVRRFMRLPDARVPGMVREVVAMVGRDLQALEPSRVAPGLRVPALVIHDPADVEIPWESVERLASAWPGLRLDVVEGVGHYHILRDAAAVERAVAFVDGTLPEIVPAPTRPLPRPKHAARD